MSFWTGSSRILKSKGMRPRDEQNVSKLQGRTYEHGKYWNDESAIVTNIVALPSKMAPGAINATEKKLALGMTLKTAADAESNRQLIFATLKLKEF